MLFVHMHVVMLGTYVHDAYIIMIMGFELL